VHPILKHDEYVERLYEQLKANYDQVYRGLPLISRRGRLVGEIDLLGVHGGGVDIFEVKCSFRPVRHLRGEVQLPAGEGPEAAREGAEGVRRGVGGDREHMVLLRRGGAARTRMRDDEEGCGAPGLLLVLGPVLLDGLATETEVVVVALAGPPLAQRARPHRVVLEVVAAGAGVYLLELEPRVLQ